MLGSAEGVFERFGDDDTAARIIGNFERAAAAYGLAMMYGQALEFAVRLAAPALTAPVDDGAAARHQVEAGRRRRLNDAIHALRAVVPADFEMPDDLHVRLDAARQSRNELAHDFWISAVPRLLGTQVDDVLQELEAARRRFEGLLNDLVETVFRKVRQRRGIADDAWSGFLTASLAVLVFDDQMDGLDLLEDGEEIISRMVRLLGVGDTVDAGLTIQEQPAAEDPE